MGEPVKIRNPNSTRPWQHVLEPLSGYLSLAAYLSESSKYHGEAFNFGPPAHQNHTVEELVNEIITHWPDSKWVDKSTEKSLFLELAYPEQASAVSVISSYKGQVFSPFHRQERLLASFYSVKSCRLRCAFKYQS